MGTWKKGDDISVKLNQNISWQLYHDGAIKQQGEGNIATFKIEDMGTYELKSGTNMLLSQTIAKESLFSWWNNWYWIGVIFVIGLIYYFFFYQREDTEGIGLTTNTNTGV